MRIGDKRLVNEREIAHQVGLSSHWFSKARYKKLDIPYYVLSNRVYYNVEEVEQWFREHMIKH